MFPLFILRYNEFGGSKPKGQYVQCDSGQVVSVLDLILKHRLSQGKESPDRATEVLFVRDVTFSPK